MDVVIPVDSAWAVGLVLAVTRVAAFAVASPVTGRALPAPARLSITFAVALAMAQPVSGVVEPGELFVAGAVNAAIGMAMGWVSGVLLHLFTSAGGIIDLVSGLSLATVFDPMQGDQGGVFARLFHLTGLALFIVGGGLALLIGGLVASTRILPLDAVLTPRPGLTGVVIELVSALLRSAVELALPVIGVLLMLELAMGLAARFAPQANVFMLGMPAKILAAITVVGSAWVLFPDAIALVESSVVRSLEAALRGLGGTGPVG
ncbi:flagellar biosynthetic protein FliR [Egicoccus halophilus]|uniref:Flagellar biosynthetic protein FliR n=1 Tax=Egicoccus halophilus TaxID=1670830 RepID=A0A8J3AFF9_9ACTN|nr:flagellar biosynthetic protein FliR [Egicoccus halophilus]GGI06727.1 flagellar biosynthetic protein FliR [Egicoccus halophilus]